MARKPDVNRIKKALMRSNTSLLLTAVILFQFSAALLLAFKGETVDVAFAAVPVNQEFGNILLYTFKGVNCAVE